MLFGAPPPPWLRENLKRLAAAPQSDVQNPSLSAMLARFSNRVMGLMKASLTVPVGPLRCLPMMISATP